MTVTHKKSSRRTKEAVFLTIAATIVFLLLLIRSDVAVEYMKKGLKLCANTVIPSLFPFMAVSELIVRSGLGAKVGKLLSRPVKGIFGVSEGGACAFILGIVCGFPIGAKTIATMLERGEISKNEAERALTFCNNPGSAFVISAVGVSLFGSMRLGITLYVCVLLSAITVGAAARLIIGKKSSSIEKSTNSTLDTLRSSLPNDSEGHSPVPQRSALSSASITVFTSAIQSSATSMLTVCALVAFFSSFVGILGAFLSEAGAPKILTAAIFGIFELSSGVGMAAELQPRAAILLTAATLGWSGLSVHLQVMTACAGQSISFKPYVIAKMCQGAVCSALTASALKLFPLSEETFAKISDSLVNSHTYSNATFVCAVFLIASISPIFVGKINGK